MKFPAYSQKSRSQQGYVLLALVLCVALMAVAAAVIAPSVATEIRRDREEEMMHRAAEYRRAVRRFAKQTGRFPLKLDDLEGTDGMRYLRKRYRDPITGKDFRVLRMSEIPAMTAGADIRVSQPATNGDGSSDNQESSEQSKNPGAAVQANSATSSSSNLEQFGSSPEVNFGLIIGVVSRSPKKTIREFNQKRRYNQWFFFYDPNFDRGYEIKGPTPLTRVQAPLTAPTSSGPLPPPATPPTQPATQQ